MTDLPEDEVTDEPHGAPSAAELAEWTERLSSIVPRQLRGAEVDFVNVMLERAQLEYGHLPHAQPMLQSIREIAAGRASSAAKRSKYKPRNFGTRRLDDEKLARLAGEAGISPDELRLVVATDGSSIGVVFPVADDAAAQVVAKLRDSSTITNWYPVVVDRLRALDAMLWSPRRAFDEVVRESAELDGAALMDAMHRDNLEGDDELAEWDRRAPPHEMRRLLGLVSGPQPLETSVFPSGVATRRGRPLIVLVACRFGWQVPAALGWNAHDFEAPAWWCAVLRYLETDVGAVLVAINDSRLEFVLRRPITDEAIALVLARRITAVSGLDGSAGYTSTGELAARLLHSDRFSMCFD